MEKMSAFDVLVPVSSEDALVVSWAVQGWNRFGVSPLFVVDSKYSKSAVDLLHKEGAQRIAVYENPLGYVEAGYENLCQQSENDWIFRVDIDELPVKWNGGREIISHIELYPRSIGGVKRNQLFWEKNRLYKVTDPRYSPLKFLQKRLFNRQFVEWDTEIHTPGFFIPPTMTVRDLGPTLQLNHFSWVFRSASQIREKSARYDLFGQTEANRVEQEFDFLSARKKRWRHRALEKALLAHIVSHS